MPYVNLFGEPVDLSKLKKTVYKERAYPAPPGTGPADKTCRDCKNYTRVEYSKAYLKCGLMRSSWTGGPGTDIKASAPACRKYEPAKP